MLAVRRVIRCERAKDGVNKMQETTLMMKSLHFVALFQFKAIVTTLTVSVVDFLLEMQSAQIASSFVIAHFCNEIALSLKFVCHLSLSVICFFKQCDRSVN